MPVIPENLRDLVARLNKIDQKEMPNPPTREALAVYNGKRAVVLEEIIAKFPPRRQKSGSSNWSIASPRGGCREAGRSASRPTEVDQGFAGEGAEPALAAYVAFRYLQTENNIALATNAGPVEPVQEKWRTGLEEFVRAFPSSDETPEAILRLAMAFEFAKDGEKPAKEWYGKLRRSTPGHPQAAKGAARSSAWRASASRSMSRDEPGHRPAVQRRESEGQARRGLLLGELESVAAG